MTNLTTLELQVLTAIDNSEYGYDDIMEPVWFFSVADNMDCEAAQLSGIISSLHKKGLAHTFDEGTEDHIIQMTSEGVKAYIEEVGTANKPTR